MGKVNKTHQEMVFADSIGQKATVKREQVGVEHANVPNKMLADIGLYLLDADHYKLKHYTYRGSAAVHIFTHEGLNLLDFVAQAQPMALYGCPEDLAARACEDLIREMKSVYGKRSGKLRSGF